MTILEGQRLRNCKTGEVREVTVVWDDVLGDVYVDFVSTSRPLDGIRHIRLESFRRWAKGAELIDEKETV